MPRRLIALLVALLVPALIFIIVIGLNESSVRDEAADSKTVNFDVAQRNQIKPPKPKPKKQPERRARANDLPDIKPLANGSSLPGAGLSFGVPGFDESGFAELSDGGLLDHLANNAMDDASVDTPPKVKRRAPLVYPELARKQGISGHVTMSVLIDENGNVEDVEVVESKPQHIFELMADSTIRQWKFEPATYQGKRVKVWATQKLVFKLN